MLGAYVKGPMPGALAEFATQKDEWDVVNTPLWSTETVSYGTPFNTVQWYTRIYSDKVFGNTQAASQMPSPFYYLVRALRFNILSNFYFETAIDATNLLADIDKIMNGSHVIITIGPKIFGDYPTWMIPAGGGLHAYMSNVLAGAAAATERVFAVVTNGVPESRNVLALSKPLLIGPNQTFRVELQTVSQGLTLTGAATGGLNLQFVFDGEYFRPVA